ncbi:helix-turn-helix domain-containing protein [Paenibacillus sp. YN15]|uniref:helix-turn-helix domain-containing protein n=1 Tax=Paenibacillus sp. YN15 TaxID=1742774 RepID=UPI000DCED031|nr:helix-turn-helix domain-containing protein [Paenibacillus sp. YN15]RAU92485.1 DNA-binding protein [Paenibacillus sp. YN15]
MNTVNLIEALKSDISSGLEKSLIEKLTPIIKQKLYANVFDLKEAAQYLKVSESTLRRMIAEKEIPFFRIRGQLFFRQADIDCWIEAQVVENSKVSG